METTTKTAPAAAKGRRAAKTPAPDLFTIHLTPDFEEPADQDVDPAKLAHARPRREKKVRPAQQKRPRPVLTIQATVSKLAAQSFDRSVVETMSVAAGRAAGRTVDTVATMSKTEFSRLVKANGLEKARTLKRHHEAHVRPDVVQYVAHRQRGLILGFLIDSRAGSERLATAFYRELVAGLRKRRAAVAAATDALAVR